MHRLIFSGFFGSSRSIGKESHTGPSNAPSPRRNTRASWRGSP